MKDVLKYSNNKFKIKQWSDDAFATPNRIVGRSKIRSVFGSKSLTKRGRSISPMNEDGKRL